MSFSGKQVRVSQRSTDKLRQRDAELRDLTIVGDQDGFWLSQRIEELQTRSGTIRSGRAMEFSFLSDEGEAVLPQIHVTDAGKVIAMPAGSIVCRHGGDDYESWVFRVHNGFWGAESESFDLAYRKIAIDAHMLYLKAYHHRR